MGSDYPFKRVYPLYFRVKQMDDFQILLPDYLMNFHMGENSENLKAERNKKYNNISLCFIIIG